MTKYLISGYIGFDNFGDEAILKTLVTHLKTKNPEKITVISSNPNRTKNLYNVETTGMFDFIKPVIETDVLISGGGSLLQDITSLKSLLYYLSIIMFSLVLNKKVVIFAQGFTPFRTKIGKFLTSFVLKKCHKIYVRDFESQKLLENLDIKSTLVSDPVYAMEIKQTENKRGVGVQLRGFHTLDDKFLDNLADSIAQNFAGENIKLLSLQDKIDLPVLEKFSQKLKDRGIDYTLFKNMTIEETINTISSLEYLIGMRFHANLIAAKAGVKILGINYDIKVLTLAQSTGFPIIGFMEETFSKEFKSLIDLDASKYNIPSFIFPEI